LAQAFWLKVFALPGFCMQRQMATVVARLVTLIIASLALAAYIPICAHAWWRQCQRARLVDQVHAVWANARSGVPFFSAKVGIASEMDLVTVEVSKLFVRRRLQLVRGWMSKASYISVVYQIFWIPALFATHASVKEDVFFMLSIHVCLIAFQTLTSFLPKTFMPTTVDSIAVVVLALWCVRIVWEDDPYQLLSVMPLTALSRCGISLLITCVSTRVLANAGFATVTCVKLLSVYRKYFREDAQSMDDSNVLITREVSLTLLILITCYVVDANIWAEAKATVFAKSSRRSEVMANLLLNSLCDAVVHLSDSLHICKPAKQLAALLLLRSQKADLVGIDFLGLVAEIDRQKFSELSAASNGLAADNIDALDDCRAPPAQLMNVHLSDSSGTRVSVQLLLATCLNLDDSICHIVGIREVGCEEGLPYRLGPPSQHPALQAQQNDTGSSTSSDSADTDSMRDTSSESGPPGDAAVHDDSEVSLIIDSTSHGCLILECDPLPRGLGASSFAGATLDSVFGRRQSDRLVRAIQKEGNALINSMTEEHADSLSARKHEFGSLTLKPRGRQSNLKYYASCTISVAPLDVDSMDADEDFKIVETLTLRNIHPVGMSPGSCGDARAGHRDRRGSPSNTPIETLSPLAGANRAAPDPSGMALTAGVYGSPSRAVASL